MLTSLHHKVDELLECQEECIEHPTLKKRKNIYLNIINSYRKSYHKKELESLSPKERIAKLATEWSQRIQRLSN